MKFPREAVSLMNQIYAEVNSAPLRAFECGFCGETKYSDDIRTHIADHVAEATVDSGEWEEHCTEVFQ